MRILYTCFFFLVLLSCSQDSRNIESSGTSKLFNLVDPSESNLVFSNAIRENSELNVLFYEYYHNGGGVSIGDMNNDGLPDVYLTSTLFANRLFLNLGKLKFKDITDSSGVGGGNDFTTGTTMIDINSDGFLDIYVCKSGRFDQDKRANHLYVNNGDLTFTESALDYGIADTGYGTQAYFFDVENDGDLDLFLVNHQVEEVSGKAVDMSKVFDCNSGDKLYINNLNYYSEASSNFGIIQNTIGYGLSASLGDFNSDGFTDIYVCNDYKEHDYFYMNVQGKYFEQIMESSMNKISFYSMGSDAADINSDGLLDLFVADMSPSDNYRTKTNMSGMDRNAFSSAIVEGFHYQYMYNTFQLNRGVRGSKQFGFSEIAFLTGTASTDWSWAPLFADYDNDGLIDLFVTNGLRKDARNNDFMKIKRDYIEKLQAISSVQQRDLLIKELLQRMPSKKLTNYVFRNQGNLDFKDVSEPWGISIDSSFSNGMAFSDLDNDGDLDLIVNNIDDNAFLYENDSKFNFIKIGLKGPTKNINGIGSKLFLLDSKDSLLGYREVFLSRGYLSSVGPEVIFGLGSVGGIFSIKVIWPDGKVETKHSIKLNSNIKLDYSNAVGVKDDSEIDEKCLFVESNIIEQANHKENSFDDFDRELLLPHKMSQEGPGLAVGDVNGDGLDDFYLGSSIGTIGGLYIQKDKGDFRHVRMDCWSASQDVEEISASFLDLDNDNDLDLYVVGGSNEFGENGTYVDHIYENIGEGNFILSKTWNSGIATSGSCVRPCDFDKDGDVDIFVGGGQTPGKYPYPGKSYLLVNNQKGSLLESEGNEQTFSEMGMVKDALWTDYNNDGWQDLLVVGEWMSISIFINEEGRLNFTPLIIDKSAGWWNTISEGDFNNDGLADYLIGNLGMNYKYKTGPDKEFRIYAGDLDKNKSLDIVLSYVDNKMEYPVRGRECSSEQLPFIKSKFDSYDKFARASVFDIYERSNLEEALNYKVETFSSCILLSNKGGAHNFMALPKMAQLSSINSFLVLDVNRDGNLDFISAGNMYGSEAETPRNDASYVELFVGDGQGSFNFVPNNKTGIYITGQVSNLAIIRNNTESLNFIASINNSNVRHFKQVTATIK